jgi:DNA recombination protein RmuC
MNLPLFSLALELLTTGLAVGVASLAVLLVVVARWRATPPALAVGAAEIEAVVAPLRTLIDGITRRMDDVVKEATESRVGFHEQLKTILTTSSDLAKSSGDLRDTTTRIATALGGTGVRGTWGQVTLRRVVELAGLVKHVTFTEQKRYEDAQGGRPQPDMVVHLPGDRRIVVDAKAPDLNLGGTLDGPQQVAHMRDRIRELTGKAYVEAVGAVEAIVMFVPSEGLLASAFDADDQIGEYAMQRKIALATPMTLYTVLRTVEMAWLEQSREENANAIVAEATELAQRIATFVEHFAAVGGGLQEAIKNYNAAARSYNRMLYPQTAKMRDLGAKTTKQPTEIPQVDHDVEQVRQD